MKKLLFSAAVAVLGFTSVNAQTEQGKWMFGANAAVSFTSNTEKYEYDGNDLDGKETKSALTFNPNVNYFVMDNLAVGLNLSYSTSKFKYEGQGYNGDSKSNGLGLIPAATYFFKKDNIAPYVGLGAGFLSLSYGEEDFNKFNGLGLFAQGGVAVFLSESASLNIGVEFLSSKLSNKEDNDYKSLANTLGVGVGFAFYL